MEKKVAALKKSPVTEYVRFVPMFGTLLLPALVSAAALSLDDFADLSLEELGEIRVISVSREPERLSQSPSAIQVITREDIRRSGATNIPDALKLASNLQVAQSNAHEWVISARGFSSDVGNKLLVMVDGRSVYTPLFSGVFWDRQDYLLEDIERIEVISGPGGTLWGANAVNGVINIITRSAADTQGVYVEAGGGTELHRFVTARYGGTLAADTDFRVYGKYSDRDGSVSPSGSHVKDGWDTWQAGFRIDTGVAEENTLTVQGNIYRNDEGMAWGGKSEAQGVNLLGRWASRFSNGSDMALQLYYDRTELTLATAAQMIGDLPLAAAGTFRDDLDTYDVDFQQGFSLGEQNRLVWGLAYRFTHDRVENSPGLAFYPQDLDQKLYSAFIQDEITLVPDKWTLTLGTKVEHNDYTGWETVPSARLQWNVDTNHMLWSAVSSAVRTPSRIDREYSQPAQGQPPLGIVILTGGNGFESESVTAWEAGYRGQPLSRFSTSISAFYNEYDDIRSTSLSPPDPVFGLPFPLFFENNLEGETWGVELSADYQMRQWWRLSGGFTLLREDIRVKSGAFDFNNALNENADPEYQFSLSSSMDLPGNWELDANLRWVDDLVINNAGVADRVPDYTELSLRLGWKPGDNLELSITGQNLLDSQHPEFSISGPDREEIERSVYGKIAWRF